MDGTERADAALAKELVVVLTALGLAAGCWLAIASL